MDDDTTKLSTKYSDLSKDELNLKHSIEVVRQQHEGLGREYDGGVRDLALVKEKEAALMGDK